MKISIYISMIILGLSVSCNSIVQEKRINEETTVDDNIKDTVEEPSLSDSNTKSPSLDSDSTVFVDLLSKFYYKDNEYFIPLYFIDDYSDTAVKELTNTNAEVVYEDEDNRRTKLDEQVAKKHLLIDNLNQIVVFNRNQEIIDTLKLHSYEYYEANIESTFIATYKSNLSLEDKLILSLNGLQNRALKKSPEFYSDKSYTNWIIKKNSFKPDDVYSSGHFKL